MSAYLCDDDTFDYLVTAAMLWARNQMPDASEVAAILYRENVRSLAIRYGATAAEADAGDTPYVYRPVPVTSLTPVAVIKSCDCLRYQSCESADYDQTQAARLLDIIREAAINMLAGYRDAQWGWTRQPEPVAERA